ncbi:MAG TPA: RnfABCDGE type electron transport complex subunit D [Tissierellaceae bacterium]|nr:RnfABCDGE type electron transport complex subunit D [Tissierellaceae bacterium]
MFGEKLTQYFMKQKMMRTVIISLIPIILASIYFFGWRSLILLIVVTFFGLMTEYLFEKTRKKKISEAVFVTCILYTMTLPPTTPYWVAVVGIIFGVFFGKAVFGGFGRNIFNPALVARAFVYISFPEPLTISWSKVATGFPGGFATYLTEAVDASSTATPMLLFRDSGAMVPKIDLLLGNVAGSLGETSAILIILAGIYLIYKKVASWEIMVSTIIGFVSLSSILYLTGNPSVPHPLYGILTGGFLFGTIFMATDPISSPRTKEAKWVFGIIIGIVTVIIRGYALFAGGMMFSILIANTFAPIMDEVVKLYKDYKKERIESRQGVEI